nr:MAG TPA: hypothetical protein [Caudoviricetes sp.]
MFLIVDHLCKEYSGLTPFTVEETPFYNVIDLYSDIRCMQIRQTVRQNKPIRRRASDNAGWW